MNARMKIQTCRNAFDAQLEASEHRRSTEGVIAVLTTIASTSK